MMVVGVSWWVRWLCRTFYDSGAVVCGEKYDERGFSDGYGLPWARMCM